MSKPEDHSAGEAQPPAPDDGLTARLRTRTSELRRARPDIADAYQRLVDRLQALDDGALGPALGAHLPPFVLPDQDGRLISLESLCENGPVVINLNRGHWCSYCQLELRELARVHTEVAARGAQIVSIMPETARFTRSAIVSGDLPFPVLSDIDLAYALTLGLVFWVGPEIAALYEREQVELAQYQSAPGRFLPISARFVVDPEGRVVARHVDLDFRTRMETETMLAALRSVADRVSPRTAR